MKTGMSLESLLTEVTRQRDAKKDFIASTKESIRMVEMDGFDKGVALVLLAEGNSELQRFSVTENCHRQIASRLQIPWKYYDRLLTDHRDLVIHQTNALFEREPSLRLIRTMDGKARAFLSNKFELLDNAPVLEQVLPPIVKGDIKSTLLSSHVGENNMYLKVLFTDDRLAQDIGEAPRSQRTLPRISRPGHTWYAPNADGRDIIRPGAIISNSETGNGSLEIEGFFWRDFCDNGCVWGMENAFNFSRRHVGGRLTEGEGFALFSDDTKRKQRAAIIGEVTDCLMKLSSIEAVTAMGDRLRAIKNGEKVTDVFASVDQVAKEVQLTESEKKGVLESFIRDGDYSQWGMVNAVTEQANKDEASYERATELEQIGATLIKLNQRQWHRIVTAEPVMVAA